MMESFLQQLQSSISETTPRILLASVIFIVGWFLSRIISKAVFTVLVRTRFDRWASDRLGVDTSGKYGHRFERLIGRIVFYALVVVTIILSLDTIAAFEAINDPLKQILNDVVAALPRLLLALVIGAIAYFIAKIVSFSLTRALSATALDKKLDRLGLSAAKDSRPPSRAIGNLVFWFILIMGIVQGLAALQLEILVEPIQGALNEFVAIFPNLFGAGFLLFVGFMGARIIGQLCAGLLADIGFDGFVRRNLPVPMGQTGTNENSEDDDSTQSGNRDPSFVAGQVIVVLINMLIAIEALSIMNLNRLSELLEGFMSNVLPDLAVAAAILLAGAWAGNWTKKQLDALYANSLGHLPQFLGSGVRVVILVFAVAMALQQLGVAPELIRTAFAILFGALCLALSLAFGLGGREVAGDFLKNEVRKQASDNSSKATGE